jgi:dGTPase
VLKQDELPSDEIELLGRTGARRIDRLVHDLVETSQIAGDIRQSEEVGAAMLALRSFMFERVYLGPHTRPQHEQARAVVTKIFEHLVAHPDRIPPGNGELADRLADYLAGMTDRYALSYAERI